MKSYKVYRLIRCEDMRKRIDEERERKKRKKR